MDRACPLQPLAYKRFLFAPIASEIIVVLVQFFGGKKKKSFDPRFQVQASTLILPLATGKDPGFVSHLGLSFLLLNDNSGEGELLRRGSCSCLKADFLSIPLTIVESI